MPFHRSFAALVLLAAATASGPLAAQSYADRASGLAVDPPKPFTAQPGPQYRQFDTTIDVASTTDKRACLVGFKNLPKNASLSRAEINTMTASPEWQNAHKSLFGPTGTVSELSTFDHQGYTGIEMILAPKLGPGAETARMVVSTIETAKGRTSLICVADRDSFGAALPEFRAVRATIRAPE
jgi:hypothetical protein